MTALLERVIARLKALPEDEQNAIAARLLAELEDEKTWNTRFEATTSAQWDQLALMVRQEIESGGVVPSAEVFPTQPNYEV